MLEDIYVGRHIMGSCLDGMADQYLHDHTPTSHPREAQISADIYVSRHI